MSSENRISIVRNYRRLPGNKTGGYSKTNLFSGFMECGFINMIFGLLMYKCKNNYLKKSCCIFFIFYSDIQLLKSLSL